MLQSINKYKLYFYLFFFIFLSSIFNFKIIENYQDKFRLKKIIINGLSIDETNMVKNELNYFQNVNIFKLSKEEILKRLNKFDYLDDIYVNKIIPSSININLTKTSFLGQTQINGENFYIGKNGKLINSSQLFEIYKLPSVFGEFKVKEFLNLQNALNFHNLKTKNIDRYFYYKNKRWDLIFSNGMTLMLPSKNIKNSLKIYKELLKNNNLINTRIIDLRVTNQIILTNENE